MKALGAGIVIDIEVTVLIHHLPAPDTKVETTPAENVQHGRLFRHKDGILEGEDTDPRANANSVGLGRNIIGKRQG